MYNSAERAQQVLHGILLRSIYTVGLDKVQTYLQRDTKIWDKVKPLWRKLPALRTYDPGSLDAILLRIEQEAARKMFAKLRITHAGKHIGISRIRELLKDKSIQKKNQVALALRQALAAIEDKARTLLKSIIKYKTSLAKTKGLASPLAHTYEEDGVSLDVFELLSQTVKDTYPLTTHLWAQMMATTLKRKYLPYLQLEGALSFQRTIPYEQAKQWLEEAYRNISPTLGEAVANLFHRHIDAVTPIKSTTSYPTSKGPFIRLNYTSPHCLAHDIGHALQSYFSASQPAFLAHSPPHFT